jgi:hypothetical protein
MARHINPWRLVPAVIALTTAMVFLILYITFVIGWKETFEVLAWIALIVSVLRGIAWTDSKAKDWDARHPRTQVPPARNPDER